MAKRPAEDEEDDQPKVRKRRYTPKKPADEDEEGAQGPPGRKGAAAEEDDDEDGEGSISTGNAYLDITLDFRDDCIDWSKAHVLYAIILGSVSFIIFAVLSSLFVHSWVRYLTRPSLEDVVNTYELGLFPETKLLADEALRYIAVSKPENRSGFLFLQGAALCAIADSAVPADQKDYYLMAANYLKEAARYGFLRGRTAEGWFFLGKSLFRCGEWEQCRQPLEIALDEKYPLTKEIYWYLAYAYFGGTSPDFKRTKQYLEHFQQEPTALEEEIAESHLLSAMLALQTDGIEAAEDAFNKVPHFEQFTMMRNFVQGQIEFFTARKFRQRAIALENDPNPRIRQDQPIAPVPVSPITPSEPVPIKPLPTEVFPPTAPAPVAPMDESVVREFMLPAEQPAPLVGMFDSDSATQQRIAALQSRYAQNVSADNTSDDGIIILPSENKDAKPAAPTPPPLKEIPVNPLSGDPVLRRVKELRDTAAGHYQRAIALFAEVVRLSDSNNTWGRTARLLTGISYAEMNDTNAANDHYRNLIEAFPLSPEAAAAGFFLGEYDRTRGNADAAFRSFAYAFNNIRKNQQYTSFWLPKTEIVEQCTAIIRNDMENRNHAEAVKLLELLGGIMPTAALIRLKGETYESWAEQLQSQAETTFGEQGNNLAKEAESKRRNAGAAFDELAQLLSDTPEFADLLWRSAENYRFGKDYRRGIIEYRKYIKVEVLRHRPEINLYLGEMYFNLDGLDEAIYVLEEALHDYPTHLLVPQIRLVLSHVYFEKKDRDKSKALLLLNLNSDASPISATYRDSMYALGNVSYAQEEWEAAISYWEDALKVHPEAIQAADASYRLAQAYLREADKRLAELTADSPVAVRQSINAIVRNNRLRALPHFEQAEKLLMARQQALGLSESERLMLRNTQFSHCSVLLTLEQYGQVIPKLNTLAMAYQNRPETLDALVQMAYALRKSGKELESQTTLRQAEVILDQLEQTGVVADGTNWRNVIQGQKKR